MDDSVSSIIDEDKPIIKDNEKTIINEKNLDSHQPAIGDSNTEAIRDSADSIAYFTNSNKRVWVCSFCNKSFSHQGSYGKHLDYKKGDNLHPINEIDNIRSSVKRRNGSKTKINKPKCRNSLVTSKVASKIDFNQDNRGRELTKIRRKLRDRHIKSKLLTQGWLLDQFGSYVKLEPNFAELVCLYLKINQWPTSFPDSQSYELVSKSMEKINNSSLSNKLLDEFIKWQNLTDQQKSHSWRRARTEALNDTIGRFSIQDLNTIKNLVIQQEKFTFEQICENDGLSDYVDHKQNLPTLDLNSDSENEAFNTYMQL
jgi:hypothetical protein